MALAEIGRSLAFEAFREEAKAAPLLEWARRYQPRLRCTGGEWEGPCPACGGTDRFSVNLRKNVWHCRKSGLGGDVIELVRYVEGLDFLGACERLTGRPAPWRDHIETPEERAEREARLAARRAEADVRAAERARTEARFRAQEREAAWEIWAGAQPIEGTAAEEYLRLRSLVAPRGARLRFRPDHPLFRLYRDANGRSRAEVIHTGPAMIAGITAPDGHFAGVHQTWIDLSDRDGKARVMDPKTGELLPAKKVRGSVHGGRIELVRVAAPRRLMTGEGIETCLSAYLALLWKGSPLVDGMAVWSSVSLGNLCGKALDRVPHPTLKIVDSLGRERTKSVSGPTPNPSSIPLPIPDSVTDLWLLGDGDSEPFATRLAMQRAQTRYAAPGRAVRIAWSDPGADFNDMLRAGASSGPPPAPQPVPPPLCGAA